METWLSDSRVGNNSVVEHRSRRPVLSPLRNCVDRCHAAQVNRDHSPVVKFLSFAPSGSSPLSTVFSVHVCFCSTSLEVFYPISLSISDGHVFFCFLFNFYFPVLRLMLR